MLLITTGRVNYKVIIDMKNDKLLVIGCTGFVGQHVVKRVLDKGFDTTILTKNNQNFANKF